jgi:LCP family protein required for cell wall assembly
MNRVQAEASAGPVRPAMRVYQAEGGGRGGKPPKRRKRRWLRVLLWSLGVLVLASGVLALGAYVWFKDKLDRIQTASSPVEKKAQQITAVTGPTLKSPIVFAIFGYDARPGDKVAHSDTMILLRLDPKQKLVTMLSFPRDLLVDVPGHGTRPITESYFLGGPFLALQTIQQLTGIRANYYVKVNFQGFIRTVDAFGGVWIDVDRHYYNVNDGSAAHDYLTVDIKPGYQRLNGHQALLYARYRHTDSDIIRNARQQAFLREFKHKIDALNTATHIIDLINIASDNVKIIGRKAMSADTMLRYARTLQSIPKENIRSVRLQTSAAASDPNRVVVTQNAVDAAVGAFVHPDPGAVRAAVSGVLPGRKAKTPAVNPAKVPVDVRNGSQTAGSGPAAEAALRARGWKLAVANGLADNDRYATTMVYYGTAATSKAAAAALVKVLGDAKAEPLTDSVRQSFSSAGAPAPKADVLAVIGQFYTDLPQTSAVQTAQQQKQAKLTQDRSRDLAAWRVAQAHAQMPLYYPTTLPTGSTTGDPVERGEDPFRVYDAGGHRAVHVTYYRLDQFTTFGFQAIRWKNPPILDGASATRTFRGVAYRLFLNGDHVHRVAWAVNGVSYWFENSLTDELTNTEMWRTATSFARVRKAS